MERNETKKEGGDENKGTGKKKRKQCDGNRMSKRGRILRRQIKESRRKREEILGENGENRKRESVEEKTDA